MPNSHGPSIASSHPTQTAKPNQATMSFPARTNNTVNALLSEIVMSKKKFAPAGTATPQAYAQDLKDRSLPKTFLRGPAPTPKVSKIDFERTALPEYAGMYATVIDNVLTATECNELLELAEAQTNGVWERAMVNIGGGRQAMYEDTRKCGRIIYDEQELVQRMWERVKDLVPELHELRSWTQVTGPGPSKRREVWRLTRLNERMRFLKYTAGEYFKRELFLLLLLLFLYFQSVLDLC